MGGLAFLASTSVSFFICSLYFYFTNNIKSLTTLIPFILLCIGNSLIGLLDDATKLKRGKNEGLTPKQKLLLQSIIAFIFLILLSTLSNKTFTLDLLVTQVTSPLLYYPMLFLLILGIVNCANLTDGIDGLASGVAYAIGVSFFVISFKSNVVCGAISVTLIGASLAFLIFNINPAKIFMGDTGSLLFGAIAISCAFSVERPLSVLSVGVIYVIEGASVILQVIYYKLTKKRLFKMAPIHHHLEKSGLGENKICLIAMIVTFLAALLPMIR